MNLNMASITTTKQNTLTAITNQTTKTANTNAGRTQYHEGYIS